MALGFSPSFTKESGVVIMSDFEMISITIMLFMLVFAVMGYCKKDK